MFTVSTRETEEGWTRISNDMRSKGADGTEAEFAKVIAADIARWTAVAKAANIAAE